MRVDIYITSQFTGRVTRGHGVYGIVLVTEINGKKYAKAHMAGWNDISYQKLSARAVVDAIQCMNTSAQVVIHLDNAYAEHMAKKEVLMETHTVNFGQHFIKNQKRWNKSK